MLAGTWLQMMKSLESAPVNRDPFEGAISMMPVLADGCDIIIRANIMNGKSDS